MVTVAFDIEGKPIKTLQLKSVALVQTGVASPLSAVTRLARIDQEKCCERVEEGNCSGRCAESERIKQEVAILTKALSELCSLRARHRLAMGAFNYLISRIQLTNLFQS
jgi:hypothetical protein